MGPKTRSLAQSLPNARFAAVYLALFSVFCGLQDAPRGRQAPPAATPEQASPSFSEQVDVRRMQVDVSVVDPRGDDWASVPNLPRDAFEIRIDGNPLTDAQLEKVDFDEICPGLDGDVQVPQAEQPTLVAFVDHNFLDTGMRQLVADAIVDLAEQAAERPMRVKVISYTNRLTTLTPEFTSDPEQIRAAAELVRATYSFGLSKTTKLETRDRMILGQDPQANEPLTSEDSAPRPDDAYDEPAFSLSGGDGASTSPAGIALRAQAPTLANPYEYLELGNDPRPSLAALEAVMISHSAIRGRKALVVFTSSWFDFSEREWTRYAAQHQLAAQPGFTMWAVDAQGLGGPSDRHHSRLLGYLSSSTGGDAVRSAGRLAVGFERALDQLSCYYLFSIPVEHAGQTERKTVDVRLNTGKYPKYWTYRVKTPTAYTLLSREDNSVRARLAGLMEPEGYAFPEVRVSASYPSESGLQMPISVSVMLADLTFTRDLKHQDLVAEFAWEGLVTDGRKIVCKLGDGRQRVVRSKTMPAEHPPALLVLNTGCVLPGPGNYEVRAVVEDLASGDIGAGNLYLKLPQAGESVARISALRMGRNSGRDFLLDMSNANSEVPRDSARSAFVPLSAQEAIVTGDQLILRFVSCDADAPPRAVIYEANDLQTLFQVALRARLGGERCREFEGVVPSHSLEPGEYGFALIDREHDVQGRNEIDALIGDGTANRVTFRVLPDPTGLDDPTPQPDSKSTPTDA